MKDDSKEGERRTVQSFFREVRRTPAKIVASSASTIWKRSIDYSTLVIGKCRYAIIGSGLYMPLIDVDGAMNPYDIVEIVHNSSGIRGWIHRNKGEKTSKQRQRFIYSFFSRKRHTEVENASSSPVSEISKDFIPQDKVIQLEEETERINNSFIIRRAQPIYTNINSPIIPKSLPSILLWNPLLLVRRSILDILNAVKIDVVIKEIPPANTMLCNERVENVLKESESKHEKERAQSIITRMAGSQRDWVFRVFYVLLTVVFRHLFEEVHVDIHGINALHDVLRSVDPTVGVLFLPTHKSHIDYLILSYIAGIYNLPMPSIAAGDNLDIPLVGSLFRNSGAFFMRRQLGDDHLYRSILESYIEEVLKAGSTLEFFIEGGRSRGGSVLAPKFGLLNVIVESLKRQHVSDVLIVPIAVDYEHCPDLSSYVSYLQGAEKQKESIWSLLQTVFKCLRMNCGDVFVTMSNPVSLQAILNRMEQGVMEEEKMLYCLVESGSTPIPANVSSSSSLSLREEVKYVGAHICRAMRENCVITNSTLVAAALLSLLSISSSSYSSSLKNEEKYVWLKKEQVCDQICKIRQWVIEKKVLIGKICENEDMINHFHDVYGDLLVLNGLYENRDGYEENGIGKKAMIGVKKDIETMITLMYLRNGLLHCFIADALVLTTLITLSSSTTNTINNDTNDKENEKMQMRDEMKGNSMETIRYYLELVCCICQSHIPYLPITPAILFQNLIEQEWIILQPSTTTSTSMRESIYDDQTQIHLNQDKINSNLDYLTFCSTLAIPLLTACRRVVNYLVQYSLSPSATTGIGIDLNTVIMEILKIQQDEMIQEGDDEKRRMKSFIVMTTQLLRNSLECLVTMRILKKCRKGKGTFIQLDESVLERDIKPLVTLQSMLSVF